MDGRTMAGVLVAIAVGGCTLRGRDMPQTQSESAQARTAPPWANGEPRTNSETIEDRGTPALDRLLAACEDARGDAPRYPEERSDVAIPLDRVWKEVVPLVDTLATVRARFGAPLEESDLANDSGDYPGDEAAGQPLLIYDHEGPWQVYVYLVKSDRSTRDALNPGVYDRVGTVELLPEDQGLDLSKVAFGLPFISTEVMAADGAWLDHRAPSGLTYSVYGTRGQPGRLQRVVYGPSDCQRTAAAASD